LEQLSLNYKNPFRIFGKGFFVPDSQNVFFWRSKMKDASYKQEWLKGEKVLTQENAVVISE